MFALVFILVLAIILGCILSVSYTNNAAAAAVNCQVVV